MDQTQAFQNLLQQTHQTIAARETWRLDRAAFDAQPRGLRAPENPLPEPREPKYADLSDLANHQPEVMIGLYTTVALKAAPNTFRTVDVDGRPHELSEPHETALFLRQMRQNFQNALHDIADPHQNKTDRQRQAALESLATLTAGMVRPLVDLSAGYQPRHIEQTRGARVRLGNATAYEESQFVFTSDSWRLMTEAVHVLAPTNPDMATRAMAAIVSASPFPQETMLATEPLPAPAKPAGGLGFTRPAPRVDAATLG